MKTNINEIIDYYTQANISYMDTFTSEVLPESKCRGAATNSNGGGLIIPLMGSACFTLNDTPYVMKPGMVVHAGPNMRLDKETIGDEIWRYAVIHYSVPKHEVNQFPLYGTHFSLPTEKNTVIPEIVQQLQSTQFIPGADARFKTKLLFTQLLGEFFDSSKRYYEDNNSILVEQIVRYMQENYAKQMKVSQIAKEFGLDRRRLAALFELHVGMTPTSYLTQYRMVKSKELLRSCSCTVKQIAECVGYSDNLYFSKVFKKQHGVSPIEFRKHTKYVV